MALGDMVAVVSALVSVVAAGIAWRQKDAAKRSAKAAEDQVLALLDQAESQRDQADVMLRQEDRQLHENAVSKLAKVEVWRETRQPDGGGAAIVVENKGSDSARFPKVEVRATGCDDVNVFENESEPSFASRGELRARQRWLIRLRRDIDAGCFPIQLQVEWQDTRDFGETRSLQSVEGLGRDPVQ